MCLKYLIKVLSKLTVNRNSYNSVSFCGYVYVSKGKEGLTFQQRRAIIHTLHLLALSYSQFWPVLHSDNVQMWFKVIGSASKR